MTEDKRRIQGEGDKESDRKFREAESKFVHSKKGEQKIAEAGDLSEEEARRLREIEKQTKARAKAEDPAVKSGSGGSGR